MSSFIRRIVLGFVLASSILLLLSFSSQRSIRALEKQNGWVSHTYDVLMMLDTLNVHLKEVQTAARGYIISGNDQYIDLQQAATRHIHTDLAELEQLVSNNPQQTARLHELRLASLSVIDFAESLDRSMQEGGFKAAADKVKSGAGQQRIDASIAVIEAMRQTEQGLLNERRLAVASASSMAQIIGMVGLFSCLIILVLVFWMIYREGRQRASSEKAMLAAMRQMEYVNEERRLIAQMSDFLQSCRTHEEAYELIRQNMPRLFPNSHGALSIISNSRNIMDQVLRWGSIESTVEHFPPEDCWAMRRGKMHCTTHGSHEPDCAHLSVRMPESACVPLVAHGETLGMLYLSHIEQGYLTADLQMLLRTISEQVSLALANMRLQETLRLQTLKDPLTQLYNRRYMESSLERELARAKRHSQPLSVLMIDIDHFKRYNDSYGHDVGDKLLKEFAKLLQRCVRTEDIACRYGGEEFILIMPNASLEIAISRAERVAELMRDLEIQHGTELIGTVTASIGVAVYPGNGDEPDSLVKAADKALYKAKQEGRNRYVLAE